MGLRINQNVEALNAYRNLSVTSGQMSKSLQKLSSGYRIRNDAEDGGYQDASRARASLMTGNGGNRDAATAKVALRGEPNAATQELLARVRTLAEGAGATSAESLSKSAGSLSTGVDLKGSLLDLLA